MSSIDSDDAPFLAAVLGASPDEDGPALIYADWLEERGEPERAEFVRAQVAAERAPNDQEREPLLARAATILRAHHKQWAADLGLPGGVGWRRYQRGLVRAIESRGVEPLRLLDPDVFERAPISALRIGGNNGDQAIVELAEFEWLEHVEELVLLGNALHEEGLRALVECPHLKGLVRLDLRFNQLGDEGARLLAGSELAGQLEALRLSENGIGPLGAAALAVSGRLPGLVDLSLNFNPIKDEGLAILAAPEALPALRHLEVRGVGASKDRFGALRGRAVNEGLAIYVFVDPDEARAGRSLGLEGGPAVARSPRPAWLLD